MPSLPLPKCRVPTCPERARAKGKSLCLEHERERYREEETLYPSDPFYWSRAWRRARSSFLWSNPLCVSCEERGAVVSASVVDHIVPRSSGGADFDRGNLQALCRDCHQQKRARERHGQA